MIQPLPKAQDEGNWRPGTDFTVPFSMTTVNIAGETVVIQDTNDRGFATSFPNNLTLGSGGVVKGSGILSAPSDTASGTDVTLVIEADLGAGVTDSNYVVVRLTVNAEVMGHHFTVHNHTVFFLFRFYF